MESTFYNLNSGHKIPLIGLGTSEMQNVEEVVYSSIKDGVRLIDTAAMYKNEEGIGKGIKKAIEEKLVTREELYVITKLNTTDRHDPEGAIKVSLQRLGLSYVDLYLDHWPLPITFEGTQIKTKNPLHVVWPKMESLVEKGYTKSIGVSNYNVQTLCNLLSFCKIKPACNEVEFHPYLYQKHLLDLCNRENIRLLAYNPMVRGSYVKEHKEANLNLLEEPVVKELATKYNKTPGQIALNWIISLGVIPIPRTSSLTRMKENLGGTSFKLSQEDLERISALNKNYRFCGTTKWEAVGKIDMFA